jgi:uncharacterized protein
VTITKDYIPVFKGIDLSQRRLPVLIADSGVSGPVFGITAAIHGDEVTGTAVIQSLFKLLVRFPLVKGKIFAFPILNPPGFETISRHLFYDGADLNRFFHGTPDGSAAERFASIILRSILDFKPDLVVDLHTDSANSIAYTLVDKPSTLTDLTAFQKSLTLAKRLKFAWAVDTDDSVGYPAQNCLTGQLIFRGIPAVTIELGGPLIISDSYRKLGLESLWKLLLDLGMVTEPTSAMVVSQNTGPASPVYTFRERVRTESTGIIEYRVKPGDQIKKDQILGIIRNVFGETIEVIHSPIAGMLFSHEDQSVVFPGLALFTLASAAGPSAFPPPLDL